MRKASFGAFLSGFIAVGLLIVAPAATYAGPINIDFSGADIQYDGTNITTVGDPEELDTLTVTTKGGSLTLLEDISVELFVPDVPNIPLPVAPETASTVTSAAGGTLRINLPGDDFLDVGLEPVSVTFVSILDTFQFVFLATVADPDMIEQSFDELRNDIRIFRYGDQISFSLAAVVDPIAVLPPPPSPLSFTVEGGFVTEFFASANGAVDGPALPEPASAMLVMTALSGLMSSLVRVRRS